MGVDLREIIPHSPLSFEELAGKVVAIDAFNSLYQFLTSIRQKDGTPLMDSKGNITSHLSGLLYRTTKLVEMGIKPVYVFDGEPPKLKGRELEERKELKEEAEVEWKRALAAGDLEEAFKYAKRTSRLTDAMVEDAKRLLDLMGIPWVQAPSEGEAQCAHMCKKGDAWATGSQDYDSLLFGAERLVKGLTLSGKLELSLVELRKVLEELGITREQLIDVAILVGTDFNEGVKGVGPKRALRVVKEGKVSELELNFELEELRQIFLRPAVSDSYELRWKQPDEEGVVRFLCDEHDFSEERVRKSISNLRSGIRSFSQQSLAAWF